MPNLNDEIRRGNGQFPLKILTIFPRIMRKLFLATGPNAHILAGTPPRKGLFSRAIFTKLAEERAEVLLIPLGNL